MWVGDILLKKVVVEGEQTPEYPPFTVMLEEMNAINCGNTNAETFKQSHLNQGSNTRQKRGDKFQMDFNTFLKMQ